MTLASIGILIVLAFALIRSILSPRPEQSVPRAGVLPAWHSDYKQLRVEYHRSIDKSVSPPR